MDTDFYIMHEGKSYLVEVSFDSKKSCEEYPGTYVDINGLIITDMDDKDVTEEMRDILDDKICDRCANYEPMR